MFPKSIHFRLSILASALLLWWVWMHCGAIDAQMNAVAQEPAAIAAQQAAIATRQSEKAYDLVFDLTIYLVLIISIWSHGLFGHRLQDAG